MARIKKDKSINKRMMLVIAVWLSFVLLLVLRVYSLQITDGERNQRLARSQTERSRTIYPRRGKILDRMNRTLVTNKKIPGLVAHPILMDDEQKTKSIQIVKHIFGGDCKTMQKRIMSKWHYASLKHRLTEKEQTRYQEALAIYNDSIPIPGLRFEMEDKRYYPHNKLAASVVGFANFQMKGQIGVEGSHNESLKGKAHKIEIVKDAKGNSAVVSRDLSIDVPAGDNLTLTIDKAYQYVSEKALARAYEEHKPAWAVAIVMDPNTGAVLSMAQEPGFNPNIFNKEKPNLLKTYSVANQIEPGSTFKVFTLAASLNSGKHKPSDMIDCTPLTIRNKTITDSHKHDPILSMTEIMETSSNTGSARLALELGADPFKKFLKNFGFGKKTGLGLPGEINGKLEFNPAWEELAVGTAAFGQGVGVSPIQLATAMCSVANGGMLMKPYIVSKITSPEDEIIEEFAPQALRRVIQRSVARQVIDMMTTVVGPNGTAPIANIEGCQVAGKTGTTEKIAKNTRHRRQAKTWEEKRKRFWTSSFAGFFPADHPRFMVLVIIDEPSDGKYYGNEVAAPIFKEIATEIGHMSGVCAHSPEELAIEANL